MGWLGTIMFWRKKQHETVIEHLEGYEVDGCFTLPGARLDDMAANDKKAGGPPISESDDDAC